MLFLINESYDIEGNSIIDAHFMGPVLSVSDEVFGLEDICGSMHDTDVTVYQLSYCHYQEWGSVHNTVSVTSDRTPKGNTYYQLRCPE